MAAEANNQKRSRQANVVPPFHQRFNIEIGLEEAQERFMNRVHNMMPAIFHGAKVNDHTLPWRLANTLGIEYQGADRLEAYLGDDFYSCLRTLEATYELMNGIYERDFDKYMKNILSESEVDLGIQWKDGVFWPSGAKLLDNALVNENLKWLSDPKYVSVLTPFEKGLRHFLEAQQQPEKLSDTITDIYEALEALAKIVTGRDKDLSGNAEAFISELKLSDHYKEMLKTHISYANQYRHAPKPGEKRKPPLRNEAEAFVYTTGLFIRLAIQQLNQKS
jgi:hypothetical protein